MAYADDIPQQDGLGRFAGIHLTLPGVRHSIFTLSGDKGVTDFRAFPEIDSNGSEVPHRTGAGDFQFSYFMRPEKVVRRMGVNEKFTCFTRVPGKERNFVGPVDRFITTLSRAIKDTPTLLPPEWIGWRNSKTPALSRVEMSGLLQGMVFAHGGKQYLDARTGQYSPIAPALLILPKSARENIEELCNKQVDNYQGSPEDYARRYQAGDLLSCSGGKIMRFMYFPQQGQTISHYKVAIQPAPVPIPVDYAKAHWKPWDQILRFLSEEEQVQLLAQHFPPEALDYVFGHSDIASLLPKAAIGRWHARGHNPAPAAPAVPSYGNPAEEQRLPWDGPAPSAPAATSFPVPSYSQPAAAPVAPTFVPPAPQFTMPQSPAVPAGPAMPTFSTPTAPVMTQPAHSTPTYAPPSAPPQGDALVTDARQRLEAARKQMEDARKGGTI